jgi:hypothetical protein
MYRSTGFVFILSWTLAGCYPPDQAIYDDTKSCVGVFDVALSQVPSDQLRRAGVHRDDVERAALASYEGALKFGANTGLAKKAIITEVNEAKQRAWKAYALPAVSTRAKPFEQLLSAVKQCMAKPSEPNE